MLVYLEMGTCVTGVVLATWGDGYFAGFDLLGVDFGHTKYPQSFFILPSLCYCWLTACTS
jgi:hypothetical protein